MLCKNCGEKVFANEVCVCGEKAPKKKFRRGSGQFCHLHYCAYYLRYMSYYYSVAENYC